MSYASVPMVDNLWEKVLSSSSASAHEKWKEKSPPPSDQKTENTQKPELRILTDALGLETRTARREFERLARKTKSRAGKVLQTFTQYKTADKKVNPVDNQPSDGSVPEGNLHWKKEFLKAAEEVISQSKEPASPFDQFIMRKFSNITRGSRLTPERLDEMKAKVQDTLRDSEVELFVHLLRNREAALAWDFTECGRIKKEVLPPQVIKTIPHSAWQSRSIPIPKPLIDRVIELLRERIRRGILEEAHGSYRNNWFLVQKKDGGLRLINDAQKYNAVTIRDAFIPPGAEEFSEEFGGCLLLSLLDLFSGYDQIELDVMSRDLTTFATPIGLFRMCTLPQGATNSVAQFMRAMVRILQDLIPHICRPFLDDICIKGPRHDWNNEEVLPGIRRYVLEHLQNIDKVLVNMELAGGTIAAVKSQWCQVEAVMLGYLCTPGGRLPDQAKVRKILEWATCEGLRDLRSFLGIVGYYRVWIMSFGLIARPLYDLMKKEVKWDWRVEHQTAMLMLQHMVTTAPVLAPLLFGVPGYGQVYLMTDASLEGWGAVIEQVGPDKKRHPCRFESGIWSNAEKRYDATKRELRGLLNAMIRFKRFLFGTRFIIETDAMVLVHQLRGSVNDIPGSLMLRWIAWIRFFDFEIRHIPGSKNSVADGLSRKPPGPSDQREQEVLPDVDEFVDAEIFSNIVDEHSVIDSLSSPPRTSDQGKWRSQTGIPDHFGVRIFVNEVETEPLEGRWNAESKAIARYLTTLQEPTHVRQSWQVAAFKREALKYVVHNRALWLRPQHSHLAPRRRVDFPDERKLIFDRCHNETGHKGRDATYLRVSGHYHWKGMFADLEKWIRACPQCQFWQPKRFEEAAQWTFPPSQPFAKWSLDIQYMPSDRMATKCYLLEARCDLSGYVEAGILPDKSAKHVKDFLLVNVLLRWGLPLEVLVDGGSEFKGELTEILTQLGIKRKNISPYNSKANGANESGHFSIASALGKMTNGVGAQWKRALPYVLHADRTTIKNSHGMTPFYLAHGFDPISPIEMDVPTWRIANWTLESSDPSDQGKRTDLVTVRAKILYDLEFNHQLAAERVAAAREKQAQRRNAAHARKMRPKEAEIRIGDVVLVYDVVRKIDMSSARKLTWRWKGPFKVRKIASKNEYLLETMDGTPITNSVAPDRIKKFFKLDGVWVEPENIHMQDFLDRLTKPTPSDQRGYMSGEASEADDRPQGDAEEEEQVGQEAPGRADETEVPGLRARLTRAAARLAEQERQFEQDQLRRTRPVRAEVLLRRGPPASHR